MKLIQVFKDHPRQFIIPLIGIVITLYFAYHAIKGERGMIRYAQIQEEINQAQNVLDETEHQKSEMEKKVNSLSPGNMDLDRLDESGRTILNVGEKNDYIIFD